MSQKTPLQLVTEKHGGKDKLVDKLVGLVAQFGNKAEAEDKDATRARLLTVSNKKLLKLAQSTETLKASYGSRDKLVDTVMTGLGRTKDADYKKKLSTWTANRLLDLARTLDKRAKAKGAAPVKAAAAPKAKAPAAKKPAAAKTAAAKPAAAKKAPAKKTSKS